MTFLATLITFTIFLIKCFLCWIFSLTIAFMVISGFLAFLIETIFVEVAGLLMTSIIPRGCSFPRVFFSLDFLLDGAMEGRSY